MATQKINKDPNEAALSAIEEALRLDQPKGEAETPVSTEPRLPATSEGDLKLELPRVEPAPVVAQPAPAPPLGNVEYPTICTYSASGSPPTQVMVRSCVRGIEAGRLSVQVTPDDTLSCALNGKGDCPGIDPNLFSICRVPGFKSGGRAPPPSWPLYIPAE